MMAVGLWLNYGTVRTARLALAAVRPGQKMFYSGAGIRRCKRGRDFIPLCGPGGNTPGLRQTTEGYVGKRMNKYFGVDFEVTLGEAWADSNLIAARLTETIDGLAQQPVGIANDPDVALVWLTQRLVALFYTFRLIVVDGGQVIRVVTYEEPRPARKPASIPLAA
jgi:hypothetical protein